MRIFDGFTRTSSSLTSVLIAGLSWAMVRFDLHQNPDPNVKEKNPYMSPNDADCQPAQRPPASWRLQYLPVIREA